MTTNNENFEYCKQIADKLDMLATCDCYTCPHCGEVFDHRYIEGAGRETEDGEVFHTCPHCGAEIEDVDLEEYSLYDYLGDALDIRYIINGDRSYHAVRVAVALGGPNVYIDTEEGAVCLYWGGETARCFLSSEARDAVDAWGEELYNM